MGGMRPSGLHVNKPVILGILLAVLTILFLYRHLFWTKMAINSAAGPAGMEDVLAVSQLQSVPELTEEIIKTIDRESKEIDVKMEDKTIKIHIDQAVKQGGSPKLDVLFLHGAVYTSQEWLNIKSMDNVANWGYRALAIDLPGKGKSSDPVDESQEGKFLEALITTLKMTNVVIVAPSASGRFALPYLFEDPSTSTQKAKGFVAVAPVDTPKYSSKFPTSQLPTLIVYGSKDMAAPLILNNLRLLPKHEIASIEDALHACYIDKPDSFHKVLYHFLSELAS